MKFYKQPIWLIVLIASAVIMSGCLGSGSPSGSKTYSLEIHVGDSQGEPIEGAIVELVASIMDKKTTNDEGIVKFEGLLNSVEILITKSGYIKTHKSITMNKNRTERVKLMTESDLDSKPVVTTASVPDIPSSLVGSPFSSLIMTFATTENDGWGRYQVIPQIGNNYNSWLENKINRLVDNMLAVQPGDTTFYVEGHSTSIGYEIIDHPIYDLRFVFTLKTGDIQAIFYRNNAGNEFRLIIKDKHYHSPMPDGRYEKEIRELIFSDDGAEKYATVLFFRRDAVYSNGERSDMNDIVEIRESGNEKQVQCVRVYGLSDPWEKKYIMHFAGITDLSSPDLPTTGRFFDNHNNTYKDLAEVYESPAIFNERDKLVDILGSDDVIPVGYPSADNVLDLYLRGVEYYMVQEALIISETLESNLFQLINSGI